MSNDELPRIRSLSDRAFHRFQRGVWAVCIGVYLTVFIGGLHSGGSDLLSVGRAVAFTLLAAMLGRTALGFLAGASLPGEPVPMAVEDRRIGSLVELLASTNVPEEPDEAAAA